MWLTIASGAVVCLHAAWETAAGQLDLRFLLLAAVTLGIGSRITIKIPHDKGQVSVSDTFVFLAILLFGAGPAVLLAAAESFCSSRRFCKQRVTVFFNAAVMALSTFLTVQLLQLCFGSVAELRGGHSAVYIVGICLIGFAQYVFNSGLVALAYALRNDRPLWATWHNHFLWTSVSYFAGAPAAGLVTRLIDSFGFYALLATAPIVAVVYFTYTTYLKNVEVAQAQAEQAERHMGALRESEERFRSVFDHAAGMALVSAEGRWVRVNRSLCEMLGYGEHELLATDVHAITHPDDLGPMLGEVGRLLEGRIDSFQLEQRFLHRRGVELWALLSVSLVRHAQAATHELIFQIQDIADRKRAEERLIHDAFHDVLTGLPNRALFIDHLKLSVERAKRRDKRLFAVLFLDLDRFKVVNDSLGHMVGDQLLIGIARRLETCLRPGDTVARLGGDEFTVLLEDLGTPGETIEVAERLQKELSLPFNLSGHEVFTTVSIGIALSTTGYDRAEEVLRDADTAMYRAKTLGKARHEVFDKTMHTRALNLLQMETDLRRAVERDEFVLHYQPIVSVGTREVRGFEALVRWRHPERGFISPMDFIPVAEETGMIAQIGKWVLEEACRQARAWQKRFPVHPPLQMSVNLSGKQFMKADLIGQVRAALAATGIDPRSLKLEITESIMMENIETAAETLTGLRALGLQLSIDDFGTGYSSLSYLHRFPISTLKIDRSFVGRMDATGDNAEIVRTIIMLARNLDMDVVAEGVETEGQLTQLKALGCEYAQGFLFSRPLDARAAESLLEGHESTRPAAPALEWPAVIAAPDV